MDEQKWNYQERICVDSTEACKMLGIGKNTLWMLTHRKENALPSIRVGERVIRFPVDAMREWCLAEAERQTGSGVS